mmetsp:Transcript_43177/g.101495  ORF Transcript_43177/g.101495 Transcript_43177/m.101495 type:complete len:153 (-) Transcript_43177:2869-3327(-)
MLMVLLGMATRFPEALQLLRWATFSPVSALGLEELQRRWPQDMDSLAHSWMTRALSVGAPMRTGPLDTVMQTREGMMCWRWVTVCHLSRLAEMVCRWLRSVQAAITFAQHSVMDSSNVGAAIRAAFLPRDNLAWVITPLEEMIAMKWVMLCR